MRSALWQIDPVLVLENLEARILTTRAARRGLAPNSLSGTALSQAQQLIHSQVLRCHASKRYSRSRFAQLLDERSRDKDLIHRAHLTWELCQRYQEPLDAFAKIFGLTANQPDALPRQHDAMELLRACECARVWRREDDPGYEERSQLKRLTQRRVRSDLAKQLRACAFALRPYRLALTEPVIDVLKDVRIGDQRHPQFKAVADLVIILLQRLARRIQNPSQEFADLDYATIGNLRNLSHKRRLPLMPRTGLALELVQLLTEMSDARPGTLDTNSQRQLTRVRAGEDRRHYGAVASFVSAALHIDYSADAAAKAINNVLERNPRLTISAWEFRWDILGTEVSEEI